MVRECLPDHLPRLTASDCLCFLSDMRKAPAFALLAATSCATGPSEREHDYLTIVMAYADSMIENGRDTYGETHSPLFASALDRTTMRIGSFDAIIGVRRSDRSLVGANPQVDVDLYAILYRLTELSGENRYAEEANRAFEFFA